VARRWRDLGGLPDVAPSDTATPRRNWNGWKQYCAGSVRTFCILRNLVKLKNFKKYNEKAIYK